MPRAEGTTTSPFAPRRDGAAGSVALEALVGAALALTLVAAAFSAIQGLVLAARIAGDTAERRLAGEWALERATRAIERAGLGVCDEGDAGCADEAVESLAPGAVAVRGDLDRDAPLDSLDVEPWLTGPHGTSRTGNDEVVAFVLRPAASSPSTLLEADLDSAQRTTLADGTLVAARDGLVESLDLGAAAATSEPPGTLYRVSFVNDARRWGTSWFRVSEPLASDVVRFSVAARDRHGTAVGPCGGADDPAARACRASVRRLDLELELVDPRGRRSIVQRAVRLAAPLGVER